MELDVESDDDDDELSRPLVRNPVLFDAGNTPLESSAPGGGGGGRKFTDMPRAVQAVHDRDTEDVWAEFG